MASIVQENATKPAGMSKTMPGRNRKSAKEKKKQTALTLSWLEENYCMCEGVCLPRCILYSHYIDFCQTHLLEPSCAATFGKLMRLKFPNVTTRRLGTRGHSKYHYYGIGIKETSTYYHSVYSADGLTRFSGSKFTNEGGFTRKYTLSCKTGTMLPDFPSTHGMCLSFDSERHKVDSFLIMYRKHLQYILDTVIEGHFSEVPLILQYFWQGVPQHLYSVMESSPFTDMICLCDSLFYQTLVDVLIPATMQEMPNLLLDDIKRLADAWCDWTHDSLAGFSPVLFRCRLSVAQRFAQALRRQSSFLHLAQTLRPILYDCNQVNGIICVMGKVDIDRLLGQHPCSELCSRTGDVDLQKDMLQQLNDVLLKHATIEAFTEWLDMLLQQKVVKPSDGGRRVFQKLAHDFLYCWSSFRARLLRAVDELRAENGSASDKSTAVRSSVHLLCSLLDEYVLLAVESQLHTMFDRDLLDAVNQWAVTDQSYNSEGCIDSNRKSIYSYCMELSVQGQVHQIFPFLQRRSEISMYERRSANSECLALTPPLSPPLGSVQSSCFYQQTSPPDCKNSPPSVFCHATATSAPGSMTHHVYDNNPMQPSLTYHAADLKNIACSYAQVEGEAYPLMDHDILYSSAMPPSQTSYIQAPFNHLPSYTEIYGLPPIKHVLHNNQI